MDQNDLEAALLRADKLIEWMSTYIGQMAPGAYSECYRDLNEHGIFIHQLRLAKYPKAATPV